MSPKFKLTCALILMCVLWLGILLRLSLWHYTVTPADGYVSRSFDGWAQYPVSRHLFLIQLSEGDFGRGRPYASVTYTLIFSTFLLLAPFHFLFGLPYNVAHNYLPYFSVFGLTIMVILATGKQLRAIAAQNNILLWLLAFLALGFTITDPLPWTSSYNSERLNPHILAAGAFCYLSTWVFYDRIPQKELLFTGLFLAFWAPLYIPAWVLSGLFFQRTLRLNRKWVWQVVLVSAVTVVNLALPVLACRWAGVVPGGTSLLERAGLTGSPSYVTSIFQTAYSPADPRHWATGRYFLLTLVVTICFSYCFRHRPRYRPMRQAVFLLIPYCTVAIFLPQLTSIHPYLTDLFLFVPATFLMTFFTLQKEFWKKLTGSTYVAFFLVAGLILMTNLLALGQMPRFAFVEQTMIPVTSLFVFGALVLYFGARLVGRYRLKPGAGVSGKATQRSFETKRNTNR